MSHLAALLADLTLPHAQKLWQFALLSAVFAAFGRLVRGVTTTGAVAGAVMCFALLCGGGMAAFSALLAVFLLTWVSTRIGYGRKLRSGTAEARNGRGALQVLANLGTAGGCAVLYRQFPNPWIFAAMAAALAEAAGDTVSSEIGQALGGTPRLITTWQKMEEGTNGAITAVGTVAGALAAITVAAVFLVFRAVGWSSFVVIAGSGIGGVVADSLLGATVEGRGRLGNNAVNFISTVVAALIAFLFVL